MNMIKLYTEKGKKSTIMYSKG